jgi:RNA methyltransferase, TrmH family
VNDTVMKAMSSTETPPGILAVISFLDLPLPTHPEFLLILDSVRDPGNVGTILRSAWAVGVDAVWFAPGTGDPYNAKVVRSAMGAHFRIPIRSASSWEELRKMVSDIPRIYLADAQGEVEYSQADWSRPVALIVGGEAEGASAAAGELATARVRIPMNGGAESLNAAMAATVLLFEAGRQSPVVSRQTGDLRQ